MRHFEILPPSLLKTDSLFTGEIPMNCSPRDVFVSTFLLYVTQILATQNVVPGPEVSTSPGRLLKRQSVGRHTGPTVSEFKF